MKKDIEFESFSRTVVSTVYHHLKTLHNKAVQKYDHEFRSPIKALLQIRSRFLTDRYALRGCGFNGQWDHQTNYNACLDHIVSFLFLVEYILNTHQ